MSRKRKTTPALPPASASVEVPSESPGLVRVLFTAAHNIDGELVAAGTQRTVDEATAASLISRRCAVAV